MELRNQNFPAFDLGKKSRKKGTLELITDRGEEVGGGLTMFKYFGPAPAAKFVYRGAAQVRFTFHDSIPFTEWDSWLICRQKKLAFGRVLGWSVRRGFF